MKLAIVGSRGFDDYDMVKDTVKKIYDVDSIELIVSGGAKGADTLAEKFASEFGIETLVIKPDWDNHGDRAGFIRNHEIIKNSDKLIAFWDGESHGTKHSIGVARRALKPRNVCVVEYTKEKEMF